MLNVLPVLGFLLYAFFGRGLAEENLMSISAQKEVGLDFAKKLEKESLNYDNPNDTTQDARLVIDYFNYDYKNPLSKKMMLISLPMALLNLKSYLKILSKLNIVFMSNTIRFMTMQLAMTLSRY
ncbi:hypothetical protein [Holzapfeliella floricola]|uniref:hypothetical protein n=1 Tax=Holzapfeliella floricola TaxID=679249 RepID=UPI003F6F64ED